MVDDVLDLEFVFVVGVGGTELAELLGQPETFTDVFWRDKVLCYLDGRVHIPHLKYSQTKDNHVTTLHSSLMTDHHNKFLTHKTEIIKKVGLFYVDGHPTSSQFFSLQFKGSSKV